MSDTATPTEGTDSGTDAAVTTYTIKSPNTDYSGFNSSVQFTRGVGYTTDAALAERFRARGYDVTEGGSAPEASAPQSVEPVTLAQPKSRDAAVLGSAAAGPASDAFLAPIGAGEGNDPHGPGVVSPGLHAVPPAPLVPGEVSSDPATQEAKETDAARAVLVEGQTVEQFSTGQPDFLGDEGEAQPAGPLNETDPASEGQGPDAAADGGDDTPTDPGARPPLNASKDAWVAYAVAQGMSQEEAENLSRAGIQERFPEEAQ